MFEEVSREFCISERADVKGGEGLGNVQFPCTVPKLGTSLADMKMEDLEETTHQPLSVGRAFFVT
jgi:hypothetical protein